MSKSKIIQKMERVLSRRWKLEQFSRICVREIVNDLNCEECAIIQISDKDVVTLASKGILGKREIKDSPVLENFRRKRKSVITGKVSRCASVPGLPYGSLINSVIWTPIIIDTATVGILYTGTYTENAFSDNDVKFTEDIAANIAIAVHNFSAKVEGEILDKRTGAYTRELFNTDLGDFLTSDVKYFSLIRLGIDDFPQYSKRQGYIAYNRLLKGLVPLLTNNLRPLDRLYRNGKTEFVIILEEVEKHAAGAVANRLRNLVAQTNFPEGESGELGHQITISAGIAAYPEDASDSNGLIKSLYTTFSQAKQSGGNKVCYFEVTD